MLAGLLAVTGPAFGADAEKTADVETAANEAVADDAAAADDGAIETAAEDRVSIDEIRRFVSVFRAVKQAYVEPIDDERLMRAAIRGLLSDLDPHSAYLDASQSKDLDEMATGAYDGLGIEVVQNADRTLTVIAPIDDTPAARAGIRPGDVIVEIDGATISAENVDAAVESMRGAPGTMIRLKIQRDGTAELLDFELKRETIRVASAKGRMLESGIGYLRISNFQQDTGKEAAAQLAKLAKGGALQGLVLDLRSNPGGLLFSAVALADLFLEEGEIVSTRGRLPYANSSQKAQRGDVLKGAPMVVLIDAGTASAAEVVTAALQDRKRALVMGNRSFGKGSVQTVLPIDNGDTLKLTTSRYYGPSGRSIQATGIVPDIVLPERVEWREARALGTVREQDLPGHLEAEQGGTKADGTPSPPTSTSDEDFAIREAVHLLKGLALYVRKSG
ncbi:MAG: S41 family peptidase [Xanthomonadales bacterium]|nr:S41 family peptidase [Xanthomonadales bacterium]